MDYAGNTTPLVGTDSSADLTRDVTLDVLQAFERKTRFMDLIRVDQLPAGASAGSFIIEGKEDTTDGNLAEYPAGTQVNVNDGTQDEIIIALDRPQYESRRVDKWKEVIARYDTVGMNVRQLGARLANAIDRKISAAIEASSLATGLVGNGNGTVVVNTGIVVPMTDPEATGKAFAAAIYAGIAALRTNDVEDECYVACNPTLYSSLPQSLIPIDSDFTNGNGGYDTGEVKMIGGARVFSTNNLPATAGLMGLLFTSEAAGMVKMWDVTISINEQPEFLDAKLINAYFSNGVKALRPQTAVSLKNV